MEIIDSVVQSYNANGSSVNVPASKPTYLKA